MLVWSAALVGASELHVSPTGNDSNAGTEAAPLATIAEAIDRVRAMNRAAQPQLPQVPSLAAAANAPNTPYPDVVTTPDDYRDIIHAHLANLTEAVTIILHPGYHFVEETLMLDADDGSNLHFQGQWTAGAEAAIKARLEASIEDPLTLDPPTDLVPVISGGRLINNWNATSVNGVAAWVADLPDVASGDWFFHHLYVDGRRATRSRYPKKGQLRLPQKYGVTNMFQVASANLVETTHPTQMEFVALHRWIEERFRVTNVAGSTITLESPVDMALESSFNAFGGGTAPYYWDHVFDTMSEPGEWYLDSSAGKLYYIPLPGQTPANTEVIAPRLKTVMHFLGNRNANEYVWHPTFRQLGFMHTESDRIANKGSGNGAPKHGPEGLVFEYCRAPEITACWIGHAGEYPISFNRGCLGGTISCNLFRDLGAGALSVESQQTITEPRVRSGYHDITDNDILGCGRFFHGAVGVQLFCSAKVRFEHNVVRDGYYNLVTCTGQPTQKLSSGYKNELRKNHAYDTGRWLSDMGLFYIAHSQIGSVCEENLLHDVVARDYGGAALYLDGNASHWTVRKNVMFNSNAELMVVKGRNHVIENNILANAADCLLKKERLITVSDDNPGFDYDNTGPLPPVVRRNIFLQAGRHIYEMNPNFASDPAHLTINPSNNLYWDFTRPNRAQLNGYNGLSQDLAGWKAFKPSDAGAQETDPNLGLPRFGYQTTAASVLPAGWQDIDVSDVGPRAGSWQACGAVALDYPPRPQPTFVPSDIPGLIQWHDAATLAPDTGDLHRWRSLAYTGGDMTQMDQVLRPQVLPDALNGLPVVSFNGAQWMDTLDQTEWVRFHLGQLRGGDFSIFSVHRASPGNHPMLTKGNFSGNGNWGVGWQTDRFRWDSANYIGVSTDAPRVRSWERVAGEYRYSEFGQLLDSSTVLGAFDFNTTDPLYLGRRGFNLNNVFLGEIAELLIYRGALDSAQRTAVNDYLNTKWFVPTPLAPPVIDVVPFNTRDGLTFNTEPGGDYEIEICDDLILQNWTTWRSFTATNSVFSVTDPLQETGGAPLRRIYRVKRTR